MRTLMVGIALFTMSVANAETNPPDSNSCLFIPGQTGLYHVVSDLPDGDSEIRFDDQPLHPRVADRPAVHLKKTYLHKLAVNRDGSLLAATELAGIHTWHIGKDGALGGDKYNPLDKTACDGVAFSPDGKSLVVGTDRGKALVLDTETLKQTKKLDVFNDRFVIDSVCFVNGSIFAVASSHGDAERTVKLFDLSGDGKPADSFLAPGVVRSLAANAELKEDDQFVAFGCTTGDVAKWNFKEGKIAWTHHLDDRQTVDVSPVDGTKIVAGSGKSQIVELAAKSGEQIGQPLTVPAGLLAIRYSADAKQAVSCGGSKPNATVTTLGK